MPAAALRVPGYGRVPSLRDDEYGGDVGGDVTARAVGVRRLYSGIVGWLCWRVAERRHFSVTPYA